MDILKMSKNDFHKKSFQGLFRKTGCEHNDLKVIFGKTCCEHKVFRFS